MRHKQTIGDYLALLSVKYDVYPGELFFALLSAGENQKATCGKLSIECRSRTEKQLVFLIREDSQVVGQFPVPVEFLSRPGNPLLEHMDTDLIRKRKAEKIAQPDSYTIRDLRAGMSHIHLNAAVLEVSAPKRVTTRYGNYANLAKALIEDETGQIKLCLWNEQIDSVKVGDRITIGEARASKFRGEVQLSIGTKRNTQQRRDTDTSNK